MSTHDPDRRGVLLAMGAATLGLGATAAAPAHAEPASHRRHRPHRRIPADQISIQLYSLREQLAADLDGTLAALAGMGFTQVEHAGFVDRTAAEFKASLDAVGIRATSGHSAIPQPFDPAAWNTSLQDARTLGSRFVVHPMHGLDDTGAPIRDEASWRAFARDLNRAGRMAAAAGVQLGYHNHHWEFLPLLDNRSKRPFDILVEQTDRRYVHFELDLFWVVRAAQDPVDLLNRLRGRVRQFHCKDINQAGTFEDLGLGFIDFPRIFRAHTPAQFIIERDDAGVAPRTTAQALQTARTGFDYLASVQY